MTPDDWSRVTDIFNDALDRSPEERPEFMARACSGNRLIYKEVRRLLDEHDRAGGFLNSPAWLKGEGLIPASERDERPSEGAVAPPVASILSRGEIFADRYVIEEKLGEGGFGVVYSAFDRGPLQRKIALKVIGLVPGQPFKPATWAPKRFLEEARLAAKLSHTNIAAVFDAGEIDACVFMTQELAPGRDLRKILAEAGALPLRRSIYIILQICEGLAHAHSRGIVHRDVKPSNIVVDSEDGVKVTDFGIAQPPQDEESPLNLAIVGSPGYMAPEQLRGGRVDGRADIFAAGCVLYQMLTGRQPFEGATTVSVIENTVHSFPPELSRVREELPRSLDRIVARAMRKNPDERYNNIAQFQENLVNYERLRRRWSTVAAALAVVIVLAALGVFYFRHSYQKPALTEKDTIVVADFTNRTGDPVFDDTLKQGLMVALRQSPFLNVLSDNAVAATLRLMQRPTGTAVTGEVTREVCERTSSRAYIAGSISTLGNQYALGLKAVGCAGGETLAEQRSMAPEKGGVLDSLGQATAKLRRELGESLPSVQRFDTPLSQATTPSLDALKAYTMAGKTQSEQGSEAARRYFLHAIEIDPSFATAYVGLGINALNLGETARAHEYFAKAFALRRRASEDEKLFIAAFYYYGVTGELEKADQTYQESIANYPRRVPPYTNLSAVRLQEGDYAGCVEFSRQALRLTPNNVLACEDLGTCLIALGRPDEARKTLEEALSRNLDDHGLREELYLLSFLAADSQGMLTQAAWFDNKPDLQHEIFALEADTEAYRGHFAKGHELTRRAAQEAMKAGNAETAAAYRLDEALRNLAVGYATGVRGESEAALKLAPDSRDIQAWAALADAWAGDEADARRLSDDLVKRFPLDTFVNGYWFPTIEARVKLAENHPPEAIDRLKAISDAFELGQTRYACALFPVYIRGEAFLAAGQGSAASGEFQKILDHRGIVMNCEVGALAHLGIARAYALQAGLPLQPESDRGARNGAQTASLQREALSQSRAAYQDFLNLWKDADSNIPILKAARAEYLRLSKYSNP